MSKIRTKKTLNIFGKPKTTVYDVISQSQKSCFFIAFFFMQFLFLLKQYSYTGQFGPSTWLLVLFLPTIPSTRQATAFFLDPFHRLSIFTTLLRNAFWEKCDFFNRTVVRPHISTIFQKCRATRSYCPNISFRAFSTSQILNKIPQQVLAVHRFRAHRIIAPKILTRTNVHDLRTFDAKIPCILSVLRDHADLSCLRAS